MFAVALLVAAGFAATSGNVARASGLRQGSQATALERSVRVLLAGIPQRGETLGRAGAPVTALYFGDLECSACRQFELHTLPAFIRGYVRRGQVRLRYVATCTATCDVFSNQLFDLQQAAADAAGAQHRFWQYAQLFYNEQGTEGSPYVTAAYLQSIAAQVGGLSLHRWAVDRAVARWRSQLRADDQLGDRLGIDGTPTIVMVEGGRRYVVQGSDAGQMTLADLRRGLLAVSSARG